MPNHTYYEINKEKIKAKQKEYRERNKEKLAEYKRQHYEANKEAILEKRKNYYAQNKYMIFAKNRDRGNCAFCGRELSRNSIYRHIASFHLSEKKEIEESDL